VLDTLEHAHDAVYHCEFWNKTIGSTGFASS
jgi:hypothetical protein